MVFWDEIITSRRNVEKGNPAIDTLDDIKKHYQEYDAKGETTKAEDKAHKDEFTETFADWSEDDLNSLFVDIAMTYYARYPIEGLVTAQELLRAMTQLTREGILRRLFS